jgi:hypothetical protein
MELVRSRARDDRDLRARCAPVFRRIGRGLNTEFLHRLDGYQRVRATGCTETGQGTRRRLNQRQASAHSYIRPNSIDSEIICIGPLAIDAELALFAETSLGHHHAGRQRD